MPLQDYYFYHGAVLRAVLGNTKNNIALVEALKAKGKGKDKEYYGVYALTTNTGAFPLFLLYSTSPYFSKRLKEASPLKLQLDLPPGEKSQEIKKKINHLLESVTEYYEGFSCHTWSFNLTPPLIERLLRSLWRCYERFGNYEKVYLALVCSYPIIPYVSHEVCLLEEGEEGENEIWKIVSYYLYDKKCLPPDYSISNTKRKKTNYDEIADKLKSIECSSSEAKRILSCLAGLQSSSGNIRSIRVKLCSGKSFRVRIGEEEITIPRNRIYKLGGEEENKGDLREAKAE